MCDHTKRLWITHLYISFTVEVANDSVIKRKGTSIHIKEMAAVISHISTVSGSLTPVSSCELRGNRFVAI